MKKLIFLSNMEGGVLSQTPEDTITIIQYNGRIRI